jgi:hypothetical protein
MTLYRRSALARLALMLTVLIFAGMACSLSGGGDKKDSESKPTIPATITPPLTKTPIPTFTAFPTLTPFQGGGFQPVPSATRISLNPTPLFFTPFPTWTPAFASATPYPYDVRISYSGWQPDRGYVLSAAPVTRASCNTRWNGGQTRILATCGIRSRLHRCARLSMAGWVRSIRRRPPMVSTRFGCISG